jgi:Zn finger protein HypA/HybF involved in hydrogenase expression
MIMRVEGWLQCENCGHNAMPLDPEFQCACSKCEARKSHSFLSDIAGKDL